MVDVLIAPNVEALAMLWHSKLFRPNKSTVNEQKDKIMIHSSIDNFQPEPALNSEQNADSSFFCPSIANAMLWAGVGK